ncbi:hypothetical protein ABTZ46_14170 [Nocardioides sp. NPDC126508]
MLVLVLIVIALLAVLAGFAAYGAATVRGQRRALAAFRATAHAYFTRPQLGMWKLSATILVVSPDEVGHRPTAALSSSEVRMVPCPDSIRPFRLTVM